MPPTPAESTTNPITDNETDISSFRSDTGDESSNPDLESAPTEEIDEAKEPPAKKCYPSKRNYCTFCKKAYTKIVKHFLAVHQEEAEVKQFAALPKYGTERKKSIAELRQRGNFEYNSKALKSGAQFIVARRITKRKIPKSDYAACPKCKLFLVKQYLRRHYRNCIGTTAVKSNQSLLFQSRAIFSDVHPTANEVLRTCVLPTMKEDEIYSLITHDVLIILYGNALTLKYKDRWRYPTIGNRLKMVGRFLQLVKTLNSKVDNLSSLYKPAMFDTILKALNSFEKLEANTLKTALTDIGRLYVTECIKTRSDSEKKDTEDILLLLDRDLQGPINARTKRAKESSFSNSTSEPASASDWIPPTSAESTSNPITNNRTDISSSRSDTSDESYNPDLESSSDSDADSSCASFSPEMVGTTTTVSRESLAATAPTGETDDVREPPVKKRYPSKRSYCTFCKRAYTKIVKHFLDVHQEEAEVKQFAALPKYGSERKKLIAELRQRGNFEYNSKALKFDAQFIVARRTTKREIPKSDYAACPKCKLFLVKHSLRHHYRNCIGTTAVKSNRSVLSQSRAIFSDVHPTANEVLRTCVLPTMKEDEIYSLITHDVLIILYGNALTLKYNDKRRYPTIRSRLRMLGRLLQVMKTLNSKVDNLSSLYKPAMLDTILKALDSFGKLEANTLKTALTHVGRLYLTECIKTGDDSEKRNTEDILLRLDKDLQGPIAERAKKAKESTSSNSTSEPAAAALEQIPPTPAENTSNPIKTDKETHSSSSRSDTSDESYNPDLESSSDSDADSNCASLSLEMVGTTTTVSRECLEATAPTGETDDTREPPAKKRCYPNKRNYCTFCKNANKKIDSHFLQVHQDETEVKQFAALPKNCPERKKLIAELRQRGNFEYNSKALKSDAHLVVTRSTARKIPKSEQAVCPKCKIYVTKRYLRHHCKKCNGTADVENNRDALSESRTPFSDVHPTANEVLRTCLVPVMREDEIYSLITHDVLILLYGNALTLKYKDRHHYPTIRNRLRLLGRFLQRVKTLNSKVENLSSLYKPCMFDTIIKGLNSFTKLEPSTIRTALKHIGRLYAIECIKIRNNSKKKDTEDILLLLDKGLERSVNKTATESLSYKKRQKKGLPKT